jgi:hypothetical protein
MSQCENFELLFFFFTVKKQCENIHPFLFNGRYKDDPVDETVDAQSICEKMVTSVMYIILFLKYFLFKIIFFYF